MHRHRYSGRKLSRARDQRRALLKGLATSLVLEEKITTTKPKAKEVAPYLEALVTKAKKGDLNGRRQVLAAISTETAVKKLYEELIPRFSSRSSGFTRIKPAGWRRGDNAELATVSLTAEVAKKTEEKATKAKKSKAKPTAKKADEARPTNRENFATTDAKISSQAPQVNTVKQAQKKG